jgi:hypothetical protein
MCLRIVVRYYFFLEDRWKRTEDVWILLIDQALYRVLQGKEAMKPHACMGQPALHKC